MFPKDLANFHMIKASRMQAHPFGWGWIQSIPKFCKDKVKKKKWNTSFKRRLLRLLYTCCHANVAASIRITTLVTTPFLGDQYFLCLAGYQAPIYIYIYIPRHNIAAYFIFAFALLCHYSFKKRASPVTPFQIEVVCKGKAMLTINHNGS